MSFIHDLIANALSAEEASRLRLAFGDGWHAAMLAMLDRPVPAMPQLPPWKEKEKQ